MTLAQRRSRLTTHFLEVSPSLNDAYLHCTTLTFYISFAVGNNANALTLLGVSLETTSGAVNSGIVGRFSEGTRDFSFLWSIQMASKSQWLPHWGGKLTARVYHVLGLGMSGGTLPPISLYAVNSNIFTVAFLITDTSWNERRVLSVYVSHL